MWHSFLLVCVALASMTSTSSLENTTTEQQSGIVSRPDFFAIDLPVLELARTDPEAFWNFLVDPETPFEEMWAAGLRCKEVFPIELMPRLMRAMLELGQEQQLHAYSLGPPPGGSFPHGPEQSALAGRTRTILGREWIVPREVVPYPRTWEEECAAPWPWRVKRALWRTHASVAPRGNGTRAQEWIAACLELPIETSDDAEVFVRATQSATHLKSIEVVARWRRIALDPRFERAAVSLASRLGEVHRQWDDTDGRLACRTLAADILRGTPHEEARERCAYSLRSLAQVASTKNGDGRGPAPAGAILAACQWAADPSSGTAWERLYIYAFSVCEALEHPPFEPDRRMGHQSPEVDEQLALFNEWAGSLEGRFTLELEQERVARIGLERR